MKTCIIILGPYRSGTSLAAQIVEALGVDFGPRREMWSANKFNPGGYMERKDVNDMNTRLLESANRTLADPGDPRTLMSEAKLDLLETLQLPWPKARARWGLKDPRFCITLNAWVKAGRLSTDRLQILHLVRDPEAVLQSSQKHPVVADYCGHDEAVTRGMIEQYIRSAQWQVESLGVSVHRLQFEQMIQNPESTIEQIADWLNVAEPRLRRRAAALIGKTKALNRYYLELPFRAPRKIFTILRRVLSIN